MTTGYLYYSAVPDMKQRVLSAVEYHIKKVGVTPDLCLVNREEYKKDEYIVTVRPYRIPKGHVWVGMEER